VFAVDVGKIAGIDPVERGESLRAEDEWRADRVADGER
jgi:hypothetical protein